MMKIKNGGLLHRTITSLKKEAGVCGTCINLIKISDTALACTSHDKFIMPRYVPYHGNGRCPKWEGEKQ